MGAEDESLYSKVVLSFEAKKSFRKFTPFTSGPPNKHRSKIKIEMCLTGKYVDSTGSGLRISVSLPFIYFIISMLHYLE